MKHDYRPILPVPFVTLRLEQLPAPSPRTDGAKWVHYLSVVHDVCDAWNDEDNPVLGGIAHTKQMNKRTGFWEVLHRLGPLSVVELYRLAQAIEHGRAFNVRRKGLVVSLLFGPDSRYLTYTFMRDTYTTRFWPGTAGRLLVDLRQTLLAFYGVEPLCPTLGKGASASLLCRAVGASFCT